MSTKRLSKFLKILCPTDAILKKVIVEVTFLEKNHCLLLHRRYFLTWTTSARFQLSNAPRIPKTGNAPFVNVS
jgi:hypothetical protein